MSRPSRHNRQEPSTTGLEREPFEERLVRRLGDALPELVVAAEPHDVRGQRLGLVGDQHVVPVDQTAALGADRGAHHRDAQAEAGHDLPLEAGADPQRYDAHPCRGEQRGEIGHVPDHDDVVTRQRGDGLGDPVAGDHEPVVDAGRADQGEDRAHEPVHRVDVRGVVEPAQEHEVPAEIVPAGRARRRLAQDRHGVHARPRDLRLQQLLLRRAHHDGRVGAGHQVELEGPHVLGRRELEPAHDRLAGHPEVVEVDGQEDHPRRRRHLTDEVEDLDRDGRPIEQHDVARRRQSGHDPA